MENQAEFRKQVKDVLDHLYDTAYLETHSLLARFPNPIADSRLTRAQKLRSLLKEAIEALRPPEGSSTSSPEWRSYLALRYRYLQGLAPGNIEAELGISPRQLQRELHKGLDAVAALVEHRATAISPTSQELESDLNQWEISRRNCEVQTLLDDSLWMLKPILDERALTLRNSSQTSLAPVFVDATLTRQALFRVLRLLAKNTSSALSAHVNEEAGQTKIVLQIQERVAVEMEEDWKSARAICEQQGISLASDTLEGTRVTFGLPQASQRRVLVIDDNAAIHQLFERYLAPHHYEIIHARGGQEALQLAVEKEPDVIMLDVMMPNVDGWQVLRGLTSNPRTRHIPIVICSVLKEPELAFSLGARAYLKKPVDRMELVATLARLLASAVPAKAVLEVTPQGS